MGILHALDAQSHDVADLELLDIQSFHQREVFVSHQCYLIDQGAHRNNIILAIDVFLDAAIRKLTLVPFEISAIVIASQLVISDVQELKYGF